MFKKIFIYFFLAGFFALAGPTAQAKHQKETHRLVSDHYTQGSNWPWSHPANDQLSQRGGNALAHSISYKTICYHYKADLGDEAPLELYLDEDSHSHWSMNPAKNAPIAESYKTACWTRETAAPAWPSEAAQEDMNSRGRSAPPRAGNRETASHAAFLAELNNIDDISFYRYSIYPPLSHEESYEHWVAEAKREADISSHNSMFEAHRFYSDNFSSDDDWFRDDEEQDINSAAHFFGAYDWFAQNPEEVDEETLYQITSEICEKVNPLRGCGWIGVNDTGFPDSYTASSDKWSGFDSFFFIPSGSSDASPRPSAALTPYVHIFPGGGNYFVPGLQNYRPNILQDPVDVPPIPLPF